MNIFSVEEYVEYEDFSESLGVCQFLQLLEHAGFLCLEGLLGWCLFRVLLLQVDEIWELPDMMSVYCAVHKLCHQIQGSGDSFLVECVSILLEYAGFLSLRVCWAGVYSQFYCCKWMRSGSCLT